MSVKVVVLTRKDGDSEALLRHDKDALVAVTEQVDDGPVIVSLLKMRQLQPNQLGTP
jgi:hypothetical protein